jgi:putative sterol carrier protein
MTDIYTPDWYEEVRAAMNTQVATMKDLPVGALQIKIEICGDGVSPYVAEGSERHFLVSIEGGHCAWYREVEGDDPNVKLDYRFRGPATAFDEIAAGLQDPIDAALHGTVKVRGDMRFLMRQAEHVKVLLEAYTNGVQTSWPMGRPPYAVDREEAVGA